MFMIHKSVKLKASWKQILICEVNLLPISSFNRLTLWALKSTLRNQNNLAQNICAHHAVKKKLHLVGAKHNLAKYGLHQSIVVNQCKKINI